MEYSGIWLKDLLEESGLTQADLARLAGHDTAVISNIITGKRSAGPDICLAIAKALKKPPELIFRLAGLLPPRLTGEEGVEEIAVLYNELDERNRKEALDYIRYRLEKQGEDKEDGSGSSTHKTRPGRK